MNDEELLDLAARAYGYEWRWEDEGRLAVFMFDRRWILFNPLTDNGDALRLAVKLGICLSFVKEADTVQAYQQTEYAEPYNVKVEAMDDYGTCRAIVRVAAEIGSKMK